ncbi:flagellar basal body protein [Massilia sp. MB5]|uniref:flagellar basal body protein n=1 Tax=Massilia sp. MB5 TaxID=2919578 RepID=UPI001F0E859A|nr:flagellar basal body protein [Massilia sp. MB5]UMR29967.1 flagellar basal body protein [Massilia sp. MB5]
MAISALSAGLSGLQANQKALDVTAHNVANANTQNFQPQQANFQEANPVGTGVTLSTAARGLAQQEGLSSENMARDMSNSLVYKAGFDLSAKVVQAADERIGTLIDIKA